jgi:hypothetical protein
MDWRFHNEAVRHCNFDTEAEIQASLVSANLCSLPVAYGLSELGSTKTLVSAHDAVLIGT